MQPRCWDSAWARAVASLRYVARWVPGGDVFAQLMWESASSGLASAALAAIAYAVGMRLVATGEVLPSAITTLDPASVLMAAGVGFATALLCAFIPALEVCRSGSLSRLFAKGAA